MSEFHNYYHCPVCGLYTWLEPANPDGFQTFHCMGCGEFRADATFAGYDLWRQLSPRIIANMTGYVSENQGLALKGDDLGFLKRLPTPSLDERAGKMLRFLARTWPTPGDSIFEPSLWYLDNQVKIPREHRTPPFKTDVAAETACAKVAPFLSASWSPNQAEVHFLIFNFLEAEGLLAKGSPDGAVVITASGWRQVQARPELEGKIAFVAMSFDPSLAHVWTGPISAGIRAAGYEPFRVDQKEHNDDITDEILAGIRLAKFIVADFSLHRAGVYYEAGFATGLGKPVIKLVRDTDKDQIHFDTRQLNHIIWTDSDPEKLKKALCNRIVATVGPGPNLQMIA